MAIGIVSDTELAIELSRLSGKSKSRPARPAPDSVSVPPTPVPTVPEAVIVEKPTRGRSDGDNNVPDSLRKIIGEEAVLNGRASALKIAGEFGISPSSVSAYAKGATSTKSYDQPKPSIISHINKSRARAIKRASTTLNAALGSITQEKLDYADAKDLSTIAKDMSVVIRNLEPQKEPVAENTVAATPQFVIFAPQFRKEDSFEVITVNE